eukprot:g47880.t1
MCCKEQENSIVVNLLVEYVNGFSLSDALNKGTPIAVERLQHYAAQLLTALDYLHNNSVVHKVLSASSVLVDGEGNVKLTDYSISKRLADICKEDVFEQTKVRFSENALPYKSGKKGDVWRLGLLLLALSQGSVVKEYPIIVPSNLPNDFQDFLNKCVCLEDKARWSPQQLLEHSFVKPQLVPTPSTCNEDSREAGIYQNFTQYSKSGLSSILLLAHPIKILLYSGLTFLAVHYTTKFGVICKLTNHTSYVHIQII